MSQKPEILEQAMNIDLTGWQLVYGGFLELKHGLMGFFPAIVAETQEPVICIDSELLDRVEAMLSDRKRIRGEVLMLVHPEQGIGFDLESNPEVGAKPRRILTQAQFDCLTADGANPFKWAPGLVSNDMSRDEFADTLDVARKE